MCIRDRLGTAQLRELLDADVIDAVERDLQRLSPDRRVRGLEGVADLLRLVGPLSPAEAAARLRAEEDGGGEAVPASASEASSKAASEAASDASPAPPDGAAREETARAHLEELARAGRAFRFRHGGVERFAAVEDAARLRDALGVPLPMGVPVAFLDPVDDPLGDLVSRYARTHGPFTAAEAASALGLGSAVVVPVSYTHLTLPTIYSV